MRPNEKIYVTAVTISNGWGTETQYLRSEDVATISEWDHGVMIRTEDEYLMFVPFERLVSVMFDVEDEDA